MESKRLKDPLAAIALLLAIGGSGCANHDLVRVENVERVGAVWSGKPHLCMEYSTAAGRNTSSRAQLAFPLAGDKSVQLSYESTQSLARIYAVSDIMQFGHAALYRLCEASGNGMLNHAEYIELVRATLNRMGTLLETEANGQAQRQAIRLAAAATRVESLKNARDEIDRSGKTQERTEERARVEEELRAAQKQLDELVKYYDLLGAGAPAATPAAPTGLVPEVNK